MRAAKVAVIILNWNGLKDTIQCLESFKAVTYPYYEIILVDNGSTDGSVACLSSRFPQITLIENEENLGFAEGNNVGIRHALSEGANYILILNNDTTVEPGFLTALITVAERDSRIGMVGPKIVYDHEPGTLWSAGGRINLFAGLFANLGDGAPRTSCSGIRTTDYVSGCALLIKTEVLKRVGLFDKDYFLYLEDADLNFRARAQGYRALVNCDTTIRHKVGTSRVVKDSIYYYFARNSLLFMKKNGRWYHVPLFALSFVARYGAIFMWNLARGNHMRCRFIIAGIEAYIKGHYGIPRQTRGAAHNY